MSTNTETNTEGQALIKGAEHPLKKIFSSDFEYVIPSYQRPYAWTEEHAGILFDDLYDFFTEEQDGSYFLGSIVLIKQERIPHAEVIDGQQRLTTLTILLAAIASQIQGDLRSKMEQYIREPGNPFEELQPKPRLALRKRDQEFFSQTVQSFNFDDLRNTDPEKLPNEAQQNILKNSICLLERLETTFKGDGRKIVEFCTFLMSKCFMVTVSTPSQRSAFRVFSVLNDRGLNLQHSDLIKADVIGNIDQKSQDDYTRKWEDLEAKTSRKGLEDLLGHIRLIYIQEKAKTDLFREFKDGVTKKIEDEAKGKGKGKDQWKYLIDSVLEPYADAYSMVKNPEEYKASKYEKETQSLLKWLNRLDNADWLPPALLFLKQKHSPEEIYTFFRKLERLAACQYICGKNINSRIKRYVSVIQHLQGNSTGNDCPDVNLTDEEKKEMRADLNGNIYTMQARRRNYLILRLDSFLSDGMAKYDTERMTVEHVLPQTVSSRSEWAKLWPNREEREKWVHRLANLVILTRSRNAKAQNDDFAKKKDAYFKGKKEVSSFALTAQVLQTDSWTPEVVQQRQKDLLAVLAQGWELE